LNILLYHYTVQEDFNQKHRTELQRLRLAVKYPNALFWHAIFVSSDSVRFIYIGLQFSLSCEE